MQPRTLAQIVAELNPTYEAQTQSLQAQQQLIPGQIAAEESALGAKQEQAFGDILSGARRRGLGFSGIPVGEQAKYSATEYLPALARLRQSGQQQAMTLQDAILAINERRDTTAQQIYQTEQDRAFQADQAEKNRRATTAAAAASRPTMGSVGASTAQTPRVVQSKPGSFAFFDSGNKPITAAQYSLQTNMPIGTVLSSMADAGDVEAEQLMQTLAPYALEGEGSLNRAIQQLRQRGVSQHILGGV